MLNQRKDIFSEKEEKEKMKLKMEDGNKESRGLKEELRLKEGDKKRKKEAALSLKQLINQGIAAKEKVLNQEKGKEITARVDARKNSHQTSFKAANYAVNIAALSDAESQVKKLTELAEQIGPLKAIEVARHLDNYVLDKLHDKLLEDKIRAILKKRGLLE